MPDLIAQGPRPTDRWRRSLPEAGTPVILGRIAEPWNVAWDDRISREHATLCWEGTHLVVTKAPRARNAIFYRGQQQEHFQASVGEHFVIGQTTFTLLDQRVHFSQADSPAYAEQTFSPGVLRQTKYKDADRRIEALGKLPDIIAGAGTDQELCVRIVNLLLQGVPQASFVAILTLRTGSDDSAEILTSEQRVPPHEAGAATPKSAEAGEELDILHWDCRTLTGQNFRPSAQLVRNATQTGESVLHVWNRAVTASTSFTQSENVDWAFCTPVVSDACPGWAIYVAGDFAGPLSLSPRGASGDSDALQDDLKFTELTATTLGALRQVRVLQRRQDSLRNFFAPVVLDALAGRDADQVLAPRETDVSVLFCDLRGFSQQSEDAADRLLELLQRVSDALGVMTHHILANGGVVGDFHGDAAMGFWGWPIAAKNSIELVCRAALAIRREFELASAQPAHPLANFRAGLGLASGSAVAGRIGTTDQVKVTVFGPVVNLASRLEGMTKQLQASILMDEVTADWVRKHVPPEVLRVRRVAKVLPYGMHIPLVVSELLPPAGPESFLTNEHVVAYETAFEHFLAGDWHEAFKQLHRVPAEDQVKDFLTVYIAQHRRTPPPGWQGVIELPAK
ncbi:adenylate/guanylate cyclase domain-containing protein [Aureliella helgolandensis]|nr:adenylate/guanylate cyclase domain-containing protein [Aureliella helgolandensis]